MESGPTVQQLFKQWRNEGDANAGQQMAQQFSDWYYAITAARLGDQAGRGPLDAACQAFELGIVQVARTADLLEWAHGLVQKEIDAVGGRVPGGDFPNALTARRSPTQLLAAVQADMPAHQVELLALVFDAGAGLDQVTRKAEAHGGMPHAILEARYALKRRLRDQAKVPLQVVPDAPNLDLAPLPLYEAVRMRNAAEEAMFEKWLLSDIELCKDVAEFAAFAHALRGGAWKGVAAASRAAAAATPVAVAPSPAASAPAGGLSEETPAPPQGSGGKGPLVVIGLFLAFFVLVALMTVVALFVLR